MDSVGIKSGVCDGFTALVIGDLAAAPVVGFGNEFFARGEQIIAGDFFLGQQAGFGGGVRFNAAIAQDVPDVQVVAELAANQDGAMAFQGVFFRTHQGHAKPRHAQPDTIQSGAKCRRPRNAVISGDPVNVALTLGTPRAEFVAEKHIFPKFWVGGNHVPIQQISSIVGRRGRDTSSVSLGVLVPGAKDDWFLCQPGFFAASRNLRAGGGSHWNISK
jgi:hypothetical protein